jgi:hypothetical protein
MYLCNDLSEYTAASFAKVYACKDKNLQPLSPERNCCNKNKNMKFKPIMRYIFINS